MLVSSTDYNNDPSAVSPNPQGEGAFGDIGNSLITLSILEYHLNSVLLFFPDFLYQMHMAWIYYLHMAVQHINYHGVTFNMDYDEGIVESDPSSVSDDEAGLFLL